MVGGRADDVGSTDASERREEHHRSEAVVSRALDCLNPRQREIIELFYGRGLPIQEIAGRLGLPLGTVKSHLFRGRARMGEFLAGEDTFPELAIDLGLDWTPVALAEEVDLDPRMVEARR